MKTKLSRLARYGLTLLVVVALTMVVACGTTASPSPTRTPNPSAATPTPSLSPAATPTPSGILPGRVLTAIAILPAQPGVIGLGETIQFIANGTYNDGTTVDISGEVQWGSSDLTVATIDAGGLVTGAGNGTTVIVACILGVCKAVNLTVEGG